MIEPKIDARYTKAYEIARTERAQAFRVAIRWVTGRR